MKKLIITFLVLFLLSILSFSFFFIYFLNSNDRAKLAKLTNNITTQDTDKKIVLPTTITYTQPAVEKSDLTLPLSVLPSNYDTVKKNLNWKPAQANLVTLLNYGITFNVEKSSDTNINLQNIYKTFSDRNIPVLINSQIIDIYFTHAIQEITSNYSPSIPAIDYNYEYQKDLNLQKYNLSQNNSAILTNKIVQDVTNAQTITQLNSKIYVEKNTNLLQKYLDIANYYALALQEDSNAMISVNTLITNLNALLQGDNQDSLNAVISQLPNINISDSSYKENTLLQTIKVDGNYILTASPIIVNDKYKASVSNNNFNASLSGEKPAPQSKGTMRIPVFMYHHIEPIPEGAVPTVKSMYITPKVFEQQMAYLVQNNYKTLTMAEFLQQLNTGVNPTQKSVLLTFDDSTYGQYANAYPILKKYGLHATFFVISQMSSITVKQLKEMSDNGMDIESHTVSHPNLKSLFTQDMVNFQVITSKYQLQAVTGKEVIAIAFPGCIWDTRTLSAMQSVGYKLGFSCGGSIDQYSSYRYVLPRKHVSNELISFRRMLLGKM